MKKLIFTFLICVFFIPNANAYVVIKNTGSQGDDRPVLSQNAIQNPTTMYYDGLTNMGTSPWLYSLSQYWYQDNTAGDNINIVADYSVRIDVNVTTGGLGYTNYLVNENRNTLTEENLRCAIDGLGTGYQGTYAPDISNFKVTYNKYTFGDGTISNIIRVRFKYSQQLPYVYTGGHNMSCWFERIPSNGLFGQITGGATANYVQTWYYNNTLNVSVTEDQLSSALNGIQGSIDNTNDKLDETNDNLKDIDDSINDSNIDNPDFEEFEDYLATNGVITQLITLPVRLYSQILSNVNGSCTEFQLGSLFGTNLTMNCIEPKEYIGNTLWNTIDILFSGFFIFAISKKMVKVFEQFTNLEEGDILD